MLTYDKQPGNAGCIKCGLRASSKNVIIRNVFPIWPEEHEYICQSYEMGICIDDVKFNEDTVTMVGVRPHVINTKTGKKPSIGEYIRDMINCDLTGDEVQAVLCEHLWKQDPGTNTV